MAKKQKCSLLTPKTQYSNSAFQIAVYTLHEFKQAALFNSAIFNK